MEMPVNVADNIYMPREQFSMMIVIHWAINTRLQTLKLDFNKGFINTKTT